MEKMKLETANVAANNVERIGELFPNCITESKDENGQLKRVINFEMLRQMLSEDVVDGKEAYEFTWVGKKASIVEANKPIRKTLRPCKEDSVNWDTTENLYIEGDNLQVLKLLQESYLGKVKMIYIDPPYNTGNDFIYNDDFKIDRKNYAEETGEYDDVGNRMVKNEETAGRYHSDWCSMIYSRLLLARNLLSDDGVIFISIDDNEVTNLNKICGEVFGEENFLGDITWIKKTKPINSGSAKYQLQKNIEYVLVYKKNSINFKLEKKTERVYDKIGKLGLCRYKDILDSDVGMKNRNTMKFPIFGIVPPTGQRWKIGEKEVLKLIEKDRIEIVEGKVKVAVYPSDEDNIVYKPFWSHFTEVGTAEDGKKALNELFPNPLGFDTVKPIDLIKKIIFSTTESNSCILDFFSGSATTAHAVMQLNAEDGGNRKFIMVQIPEATSEGSEAYKSGYKTICEIGKERIRRAGQKILSENEGKEGIENLDIGFRVLKLDDTNMKDVYYAPQMYTQDLIAKLEENVKEDRTDLDLLFGCLLEWGLPLSLPYSSEVVDGCTIHNYNDGDLIACFDANVPDAVIRHIAKLQPLRAVFRDSSFVDSPSKINVGEIFKALAPDTRIKVI